MSHLISQPHTYGQLDTTPTIIGPDYEEIPLTSYVVPEDAKERYEFLGRYLVVGAVTGRSRNVDPGDLTLNLALEGDSVGSHIPPGWSSGSSWEPFSFQVIGPTRRISPTDNGTGLWTLEAGVQSGEVEFTTVNFLAWHAPLAQ